jgi:hypothetical protein
MSDRAAMLRETVQAFTDLRAMFDRLTEEQASRVWLGVLGVRDIVIHKHGPATLHGCGDETSQAAESIRKARSFLAPGSFWGLRFRARRTALDQRELLTPHERSLGRRKQRKADRVRRRPRMPAIPDGSGNLTNGCVGTFT